MEDKLISALANALDMESTGMTLNDKFRDYENYSSLTELSVLAMLDSDFQVEIEMDDFNRYVTVGDLLGLVSSPKV
jgi:acyl carrier protein